MLALYGFIHLSYPISPFPITRYDWLFSLFESLYTPPRPLHPWGQRNGSPTLYDSRTMANVPAGDVPLSWIFGPEYISPTPPSANSLTLFTILPSLHSTFSRRCISESSPRYLSLFFIFSSVFTARSNHYRFVSLSSTSPFAISWSYSSLLPS